MFMSTAGFPFLRCMFVDFSSSRRTYMKRITEWGFNKKIRRAEKDAMLRIERRRSAMGKRTNFRVRGQEVSISKLRRAAATVDVDEDDEAGVEDLPNRIETPSCISYETPAASTIEEAQPLGEISAVHTPSWTNAPGEQVWRTRSASRSEHTTAVDRVPTSRNWAQTLFLPFSYERDVIATTMYDTTAEYDHMFSSSDSDSESDATEAGELMPPPPRPLAPKPFKLRRFLTSTMPSLNYEVRRTTNALKLGSTTPQNLIAGTPGGNKASESQPQGQVTTPGETTRTSEEVLDHHLTLFQTSVSFDMDDRERNQHFSDVLGILKSQYDREAASQSHMNELFDGGAIATEEQAFDKVEALLAQRHRLHGYEDQRTLDACLAGVIFLLDATRLDAEQQTWVQATVRTRLDRVRSLMNRILSAHLHEETTVELLGDQEGREVEVARADEDARRKASRMMSDIVQQAKKSNAVLHVLELLPRYHRQWAGWHLQENLFEMQGRGQRMLFTM